MYNLRNWNLCNLREENPMKLKTEFVLFLIYCIVLILSAAAAEEKKPPAGKEGAQQTPQAKACVKTSWELMTRTETGVQQFQSCHPEYDGSGVVIAVLDTGVDMGVEGLKQLPDGTAKVVDCRDFTGEGDLFWEEATLVAGTKKEEKLIDGEGRPLTDFRDKVANAVNDRFCITFIEEADFTSTQARDLNGDGDTNDSFGVLITAVCEKTDEKDKGNVHYIAVIDANGDGSLEDGITVTDYWRRHQAFHLEGGKGKRRRITLACNFFPEEKKLSLHFDAQGHGTHVAGIAAGYRIHGQDNYHGMAPGAKVISLKIGFNAYSGGATITESVKKALDYGARYAKKHKVPVVYNMSYGILAEQDRQSAIDNYINDLLWKNPGIVFVTSAGNSGPGVSTIGTPGTAERAITVGALLSPEAAPAQYGYSVPREITFGFSSRGGDYFKPDILAPGSACSTVPLWKDHDHANGTSMASPAAAGSIAVLACALIHQDPPCAIDNRLIHRAVKNTGRHIEGLTHIDEGGGALDIPRAFAYALSLYKRKEDTQLREYRISLRGAGAGINTVYWRQSPRMPKKNRAITVTVAPEFAGAMTAEKKARFYRALTLKTDAEWLELTKPLIYFKGGGASRFGIKIDLSGRQPGLYTSSVSAYKNPCGTLDGRPVCEFSIPVTVIVPHRMTCENGGAIEVKGEVFPASSRRIFFELPAAATTLGLKLQLLDSNAVASLNATLFNPHGVRRGGTSSVSFSSGLEAENTISGLELVPGVWEVTVNSSPADSKDIAAFALTATPYGAAFGEPVFFERPSPTTRKRCIIALRNTQAMPFDAQVSGRADAFTRENVVTVTDSDTFTRTVTVDDTATQITWNFTFKRQTYALFTDCVVRIEDAKTGKAIRNQALNRVTGGVSCSVPQGQTEPKTYRFVLKPAFSLEKDTKKWSFILSEALTVRSPETNFELITPSNGRVRLEGGEKEYIEFRLPGALPAAPDGYRLRAKIRAGIQNWSVEKAFHL